MKIVKLALLVMGLLLLPMVSASAQAGDTVTKTFELTLNGEVPEGRAFNVSYNLTGADGAAFLPFCGRGSDTQCEGGGTVYTVVAEVGAGKSIDIQFVRVMTETETAETFLEYTETLYSDQTSSAAYTFPATAGNDKDMPDQLPDTGAGGLSGPGLSVGGLAAPLAILLAGCYAALRRR